MPAGQVIWQSVVELVYEPGGVVWHALELLEAGGEVSPDGQVPHVVARWELCHWPH